MIMSQLDCDLVKKNIASILTHTLELYVMCFVVHYFVIVELRLCSAHEKVESN